MSFNGIDSQTTLSPPPPSRLIPSNTRPMLSPLDELLSRLADILEQLLVRDLCRAPAAAAWGVELVVAACLLLGYGGVPPAVGLVVEEVVEHCLGLGFGG